MNIKNTEQKMTINKKNNLKVILLFFIIIISIALIIVSAIYFSQLEWNKNIASEYWLRYLWLCLIIISSAGFVGSVLILSKYFAKILEYHKSNKKNNNKV